MRQENRTLIRKLNNLFQHLMCMIQKLQEEFVPLTQLKYPNEYTREIATMVSFPMRWRLGTWIRNKDRHVRQSWVARFH